MVGAGAVAVAAGIAVARRAAGGAPPPAPPAAAPPALPAAALPAAAPPAAAAAAAGVSQALRFAESGGGAGSARLREGLGALFEEESLKGINLFEYAAQAHCAQDVLDPFTLRYCGAAFQMANATQKGVFEDFGRCAVLQTEDECQKMDICGWVATQPDFVAQFGIGSCQPIATTGFVASIGMVYYYMLMHMFGLPCNATVPTETQMADCLKLTTAGKEECEKAKDGAGNPCSWCGGIRHAAFPFGGEVADPEYPSGNRMAWCISEKWLPEPYMCPYLRRLTKVRSEDGHDTGIWLVDSDDEEGATGAPPLEVTGNTCPPPSTSSTTPKPKPTTATTASTASPTTGAAAAAGAILPVFALAVAAAVAAAAGLQ